MHIERSYHCRHARSSSPSLGLQWTIASKKQYLSSEALDPPRMGATSCCIHCCGRRASRLIKSLSVSCARGTKREIRNQNPRTEKKGKTNSERCDWSSNGLQRDGNFQVVTDDAVPRISIVYHITHARPKKKERKEPQLLDFGSHKNKVAMKACIAFAVSVDKLGACDVETGPTSAADCTEPHEAAATRKPRRSNLGQRRRTPFCCRFPRRVAFRDKMG